MDTISNQLNIDTPELVSIEMPIAGVGSRFIAVLVDYLILIVGGFVLSLILIVVFAAVHVFAHWSENWIMAFVFILIFLANWGYFAIFEAFWNGRTPGKRAVKIRVIHRSGRAMSFLESLARRYPRLELHLICDNYGTHKHPTVKQWLAAHPRFHLHFTPTSASWLNLVERWFALITSQAIRRGSFDSVRRLEQAILRYLAHWNQNARPFRWTKSAAAIKRSLNHVTDIYETLH